MNFIYFDEGDPLLNAALSQIDSVATSGVHNDERQTAFLLFVLRLAGSIKDEFVADDEAVQDRISDRQLNGTIVVQLEKMLRHVFHENVVTEW